MRPLNAMIPAAMFCKPSLAIPNTKINPGRLRNDNSRTKMLHAVTAASLLTAGVGEVEVPFVAAGAAVLPEFPSCSGLTIFRYIRSNCFAGGDGSRGQKVATYDLGLVRHENPFKILQPELTRILLEVTALPLYLERHLDSSRQ